MIAPVIAALHFLPSSISLRKDAFTHTQIIEHILHHAQLAHDAGVRAWYVQDTRDTPLGPQILPDSVRLFTEAGRALRIAFPDCALGVALMQHSGRVPLEIAHAIDAQFVRLKVYVGVMVKMEGMLTGCAHEAMTMRRALAADHIQVFADIYDRVGEPLAPLPLPEACRQAVEFGRADGLVITGKNPDDTLRMLGEAKDAGAPLLVGGGVTTANVAQFLQHAQHVIVHGAFAQPGLAARNGLPAEWSAEALARFMDFANNRDAP